MNSGNFMAQVDATFMFILIVSLILMAGITFSMIYFLFRYHHTKNQQPKDIHGNLTLEILWTAIPTVLVLAMFYYGMVGYQKMETIPEDAMKVESIGSMWNWRFNYENGAQVDTFLYVPVGKAVHLELNSPDVIHSFYIPELRVKKDVVPGMTNEMWFATDTVKTYNVFCAEYCGTDHSKMIGYIVAMPQEEFDAWYESNAKIEEKIEAETEENTAAVDDE